MPSSIDLSNLVNYINDLNGDIQRAGVLEGNFVKQVTAMPGVKSQENIHILTSQILLTDPTFGTVITAGGTVSETYNTVSVVESQVSQILTRKDFDTKYHAMKVKPGINNEDIDQAFLTAYSEELRDQIQANIEDQLVIGSSTGTFSTSANANRVNGALHTLVLGGGSASVIQYATSSVYSAANAGDILGAIIAKRPKGILRTPDQRLWVSYADFDSYKTWLLNKNWIAYNNLESQGVLTYEMYHPGTNVKITALGAFDNLSTSKHYFLFARESNIKYAYDDKADYLKADLFYSELTRALHYISNFKVGIGFGIYKEVMLGTSN